MHVKINTKDLNDHDVAIDDAAQQLVRLGFNPSGRTDVEVIKALGAALISKCNEIVDKEYLGTREAKIAITQIQGACMFAVAATTAPG